MITLYFIQSKSINSSSGQALLQALAGNTVASLILHSLDFSSCFFFISLLSFTLLWPHPWTLIIQNSVPSPFLLTFSLNSIHHPLLWSSAFSSWNLSPLYPSKGTLDLESSYVHLLAGHFHQVPQSISDLTWSNFNSDFIPNKLFALLISVNNTIYSISSQKSWLFVGLRQGLLLHSLKSTVYSRWSWHPQHLAFTTKQWDFRHTPSHSTLRQDTWFLSHLLLLSISKSRWVYSQNISRCIHLSHSFLFVWFFFFFWNSLVRPSLAWNLTQQGVILKACRPDSASQGLGSRVCSHTQPIDLACLVLCILCAFLVGVGT